LFGGFTADELNAEQQVFRVANSNSYTFNVDALFLQVPRLAVVQQLRLSIRSILAWMYMLLALAGVLELGLTPLRIP
jgi:hypothetical protein